MIMDDRNQILNILKRDVGLTHIRNYSDLKGVKLLTLQRRIEGARTRHLKSSDIMFMYIVWLMARSFWGALPDQMLGEWCLELKKHGLPAEIATTLRKAPLKSWHGHEPTAKYPYLPGALDRLVQRVEKCYGLSQQEQLPAGTQNPKESHANPSPQQNGAVAVTEPVPKVLEVPSSMCLGSEKEPNNSSNTVEGDPRLATITDEPLGELAAQTDRVTLDSQNAHLQPQNVYICRRCRVSGFSH